MESTLLKLLIIVVKCVFAVALVMQIVPLLIWGERKLSAYVQDRTGPNRAHILGIRAGGLVHTLVDVVKLITKEDVRPSHVSKFFWRIAPVISMTVALCTFAVVPWGDYLQIGDLRIPLQVADINGGVLYILAITSLGVYGVMLAGWSSNNKFSLLGGLRASAQMVSYELAMGLSLVVMFMSYGSVELDAINRAQAGAIWNWGVVRYGPVGFIAFILFWVSAFAETNRTPFDMPEDDASLVAGYHTEYSSLRFALFFMAEYANMIVASAVTATIFFGGYNFPFLDGQQIREYADYFLMAAGAGALVFPAFAVMALRRRSRPFYQQLQPGDMRLREPYVFAMLFGMMTLMHLALLGLGLSGVVGASAIGPEIVAFVVQLNALVVKILIGCWIFLQARWTLPRFRYDQVMDLGWKYMLPIAVGNVLLAGICILIAPNLYA